MPFPAFRSFCSQIPDKGQHLTRYYGAYANRVRALYLPDNEIPLAPAPNDPIAIPPVPEEQDAPFVLNRRRSWARLLRKLMEVDPLLCPNCGVQMKIISVIQEPRVIDRILKHMRSGKGHDPFEARAPPAA